MIYHKLSDTIIHFSCTWKMNNRLWYLDYHGKWLKKVHNESMWYLDYPLRLSIFHVQPAVLIQTHETLHKRALSLVALLQKTTSTQGISWVFASLYCRTYQRITFNSEEHIVWLMSSKARRTVSHNSKSCLKSQLIPYTTNLIHNQSHTQLIPYTTNLIQQILSNSEEQICMILVFIY